MMGPFVLGGDLGLEGVNKRSYGPAGVAGNVEHASVHLLGMLAHVLGVLVTNFFGLFKGVYVRLAWVAIPHVAALLVVLALPSAAYADTYLGRGYTSRDDAACATCGYDFNSMPEGLQYLLTSSTVFGESTDAKPNFSNYALFRDFIHEGLNGWYSERGGGEFIAEKYFAKQDLESLYRWWDEYGEGFTQGGGGGAGGGGGGGAIEQPSAPATTITLTGWFGKRAKNGQHVDIVGETIAANFSTNAKNTIDTWFQNGYVYWACVVMNQGVNNGSTSSFYFVMSQHEITLTQNGTSSVTFSSTSEIRGNNASVSIVNDAVDITFSALGYKSTSWNTSTNNIGCYSSTATPATPPFEGGPIPDTTNPNPAPDVNIGINIDNIDNSTNITNNNNGDEYEIDLSPITERLDIINENIVNLMGNINEWFGWLDSELELLLKQLRDFQWAVTSWLQMIYDNMGNAGSSNSTTTINNYAQDPEGFWDKLSEILAALFAQLPTSLQDLLTQFGRLTGVFPFSLPWDLYAMLALFVHSPTTPVFDFPVPWMNQQHYQLIHVDLSVFNDVASSVRTMELVAFALDLVFMTPKMLKVGLEDA